MQRLAEDVGDPPSQKAAFTFLNRAVTIWGQPTPSISGVKADDQNEYDGLPGFEQVIYERIVPTAFGVPSLPEFNLRDGQMMVVSKCHPSPESFRNFYPLCARSYMKLPICFKLSARRGVQSRITTSYLSSFHPKTGPQLRLWISLPSYGIWTGRVSASILLTLYGPLGLPHNIH